MKFNTSGNLGDSLYQTLFMKELSENLHEQVENVNLQINKPVVFSQKHPYGNVQLTQAAAEFLQPLMKHIFPQAEITISEQVPTNCLDLDLFRTQRINFASGDIRLWVYSLTNANPLPMNLQRQIIHGIPKIFGLEDKILLAKTSRYCNYFIDWNSLKPLQKQLIFCGLEQEHKDFCNSYFDVEFLKLENALHAATVMNSCKTFISNQCGLYSIAEMMKSPRALLSAEYMPITRDSKTFLVPGPVNVIPQGGNCTLIQTQQRLDAFIKHVL